MSYRSILFAAAIVTQSVVGALAEPAPEAVATPAPSGNYVTDRPHTSVTWKVSHFGLSHFTARFTGIDAKLGWNAENPASSTLTVVIDPLSVRTDFPFPQQEDFDAKIGSDPAFLNAQPITFVAKDIKVDATNHGAVTGDLTFRGQTHPVTLAVQFNGSFAEHPMDKMPTVGFSATAALQRSQWGLDFAVPAVGDTVDLQIEAEFKRAQ